MQHNNLIPSPWQPQQQNLHSTPGFKVRTIDRHRQERTSPLQRAVLSGPLTLGGDDPITAVILFQAAPEKRLAFAASLDGFGESAA